MSEKVGDLYAGRKTGVCREEPGGSPADCGGCAACVPDKERTGEPRRDRREGYREREKIRCSVMQRRGTA